MIAYRDNDTVDVRTVRSWRVQHLLDAAKRMEEKAKYYQREAEFYRKAAERANQQFPREGK